ncbi:nucleoside deaminase [Streptomyces sp. HPF1205]|uniref:nucleoside deaminase n=1 Tax=Streptomyces sp. HPF1205 TaxID=2873262 RepID=UPI001CEDD176|nr:nucleoside deaminase [Streptomyces sp. HPF1205]
MRLALAEAELAPLTGDVPVGAVVLSADGTVVARARNEREATGDPTAHAEILAIRRAAAALAGGPGTAAGLDPRDGRDAGPDGLGGPDGRGGRTGRSTGDTRPPDSARGAEWQLTGCTLVVTLEPCTMCAGAIVLSRLDRVVYGARDAKAGAAGSQWDLIRDRRLNHRPEVVPGVLGAPAAALLSGFFRTTDFGPRPPMG